VVMRHANRLSVHTVVHLHGGVTPAESDGFATDMVMPGQSRVYTIMPWIGRARIFVAGWLAFTSSRTTKSWPFRFRVGRSTCRSFFQDRTFNADGSLAYDTDGHRGFAGDVMLVNGVPWPKMEVSTRKYRFRVLNGPRPVHAPLSQLGARGSRNDVPF